MQVRALPTKDGIGRNDHMKIQVSAFPTIYSRLALSGNPDSRSVLNSGRNPHFYGFVFHRHSGSLTGRAGSTAHGPAPLTGRTRPGFTQVDAFSDTGQHLTQSQLDFSLDVLSRHSGTPASRSAAFTVSKEVFKEIGELFASGSAAAL